MKSLAVIGIEVKTHIHVFTRQFTGSKSLHDFLFTLMHILGASQKLSSSAVTGIE